MFFFLNPHTRSIFWRVQLGFKIFNCSPNKNGEHFTNIQLLFEANTDQRSSTAIFLCSYFLRVDCGNLKDQLGAFGQHQSRAVFCLLFVYYLIRRQIKVAILLGLLKIKIGFQQALVVHVRLSNLIICIRFFVFKYLDRNFGQ